MRLVFQLIILTILGFSQTINDELKGLSGATPAKRVELMNHIKEQLIIMNQQERSETIAKLRAKLQPSSSHQINQHNQVSKNHNQVVPNRMPTHNHHQEIQIYQEHISNMITHRDKEPVDRVPTTITTPNTNHNNEPIDRTQTTPTNPNTNHDEPVDRTRTTPTNSNTNHDEPTNTNRHQEETTSSSGDFNGGRR